MQSPRAELRTGAGALVEVLRRRARPSYANRRRQPERRAREDCSNARRGHREPHARHGVTRARHLVTSKRIRSTGMARSAHAVCWVIPLPGRLSSPRMARRDGLIGAANLSSLGMPISAPRLIVGFLWSAGGNDLRAAPDRDCISVGFRIRCSIPSVVRFGHGPLLRKPSGAFPRLKGFETLKWHR